MQTCQTPDMECTATTKAGNPCRIKTSRGACHVHKVSSGDGIVYVLSNTCMPGLLKIGWTRGTAEKRAATLSATSVAHPFVVQHATHQLGDAHAVEKAVHQALSECRVSQNREFFKCSVDDARLAISSVLSETHKIEPPAVEPLVHTVTVPAGVTELRLLFSSVAVE